MDPERELELLREARELVKRKKELRVRLGEMRAAYARMSKIAGNALRDEPYEWGTSMVARKTVLKEPRGELEMPAPDEFVAAVNGYLHTLRRIPETEKALEV